MNVNEIVVNSIITHELNALLDDKRLMASNSESFIAGNAHYKPEVQAKLSLRKKEIRKSLRNEWLNANNTKTSEEFDTWLSTIIRNVINR
jgi:hypothetical protein